MNWNDCLKTILNHYSDKPDDYVLSLGDWTEPRSTMVPGVELPEFRAFIRLELGELRKLEAAFTPELSGMSETNVGCNDSLEPLRQGAPRRIRKIGPVLVGIGWAKDWTWATQSKDNTKRTEYLIGLHRVTRATHGNRLTDLELFAGPMAVSFGWIGVGSNSGYKP